MSIKLSVCIPTYNRAAFLGAALDSVIRQATDEVEIVINDNASTDNTETLVREYQTRFSRIRYRRNLENLGADRNYLKVVELAEGDYCWLLGSDDALADHAIATMLARLGRADIYLCDRANMSFAMDQALDLHEKMQGAPADTFYDCCDPDQLLRYFRHALNIGSLFSYLSVLIVRREAWNSHPVLEQLIDSAWIHVGRIFQMMRAGARIEYVGLPLVLNRTGNDSFEAAVGHTRRRLIDLDYPRIARTVFRDHPDVLCEVTRAVAHHTFTVYMILSDKHTSIKVDGPKAPNQLAAAYAAEFGSLPGYKFKMMVWRALPFPVLTALKFTWNRIWVPIRRIGK